jgi:hypothetical protein
MSIVNSAISFVTGSKTSKSVQVAVEYYAPHWIVVIRNPGQKHWSALRSKTKNIVVQDEFGFEVSRRPAINSFASMGEADTWIKENMPGIQPVVRDPKEVREFGARLHGEKIGQLADRIDGHKSRPYAQVQG